MKKIPFILLLTLGGAIDVLAQTNSVATGITVTDVPSSVGALLHFLGVNVNPVYTGLLIHFLAKYYRNYHIGDTHESQVNILGKIASILALTPLNKAVTCKPPQ